jgi:hypothetical protein
MFKAMMKMNIPSKKILSKSTSNKKDYQMWIRSNQKICTRQKDIKIKVKYFNIFKHLYIVEYFEKNAQNQNIDMNSTIHEIIKQQQENIKKQNHNKVELKLQGSQILNEKEKKNF